MGFQRGFSLINLKLLFEIMELVKKGCQTVSMEYQALKSPLQFLHNPLAVNV